jgi:tetratricopeptide (TPR) repeat protein
MPVGRVGAAPPISVLALAVLVAACGRSPSVPSGDVASPPSSVASSPGVPPVVRRSPVAAASSPPSPSPVAIPRTQDLIDRLTARVEADESDGPAQRDLGLALLQRIRETADPSLYVPASEALETARTLLPDDPVVLVGIGGLQLGRHEFADALATAEAALELAPGFASAIAVDVDALVELGRYDEAAVAAQELADASADLPALARVSYLRELHGDLPGALEAMAEAGRRPAVPENTAFTKAIIGNLSVYAGRPDLARAAYEEALELVPDHAPSEAGLGRLALGAGDRETALEHFERAAAILPLPEYVIALGETEDASGDAEAARRSYELARAETELFRASGVDVDLELALFEADHGDRAAALDLAQRAYDDRATIRTADALAWALHRLGRTEEAEPYSVAALRLGTKDPLLRYHAGMIAAALGRPEARALLREALALDPGFSATGALAARTELERLDRGS